MAFIGKYAPESYRQNSQQSYKICGMSDEGLWKIAEAGRPFVHRKNTRYWASVEIELSVHELEFEEPEESEEMSKEFQTNAEVFETNVEHTVTENISLSGALVFSNLNVGIGDCINFVCEKLEFTTIAMVRNRTSDEKTMPKFHLEFISQLFPIQKITAPIEESEKI